MLSAGPNRKHSNEHVPDTSIFTHKFKRKPPNDVKQRMIHLAVITISLLAMQARAAACTGRYKTLCSSLRTKLKGNHQCVCSPIRQVYREFKQKVPDGTVPFVIGEDIIRNKDIVDRIRGGATNKELDIAFWIIMQQVRKRLCKSMRKKRPFKHVSSFKRSGTRWRRGRALPQRGRRPRERKNELGATRKDDEEIFMRIIGRDWREIINQAKDGIKPIKEYTQQKNKQNDRRGAQNSRKHQIQQLRSDPFFQAQVKMFLKQNKDKSGYTIEQAQDDAIKTFVD